MVQRPVPHITTATAPFWEGCSRGKLMLQKCASSSCGRYVFYPRVCCPFCHGGVLAWTEVSGTGKIASFTHVQRPQHEFFYPDAPVCFVAVELAEGPIIYGHLLDAKDGDDVRIGTPVTVTFVEARPGLSLPSFKRSNAA